MYDANKGSRYSGEKDAKASTSGKSHSKSRLKSHVIILQASSQKSRAKRTRGCVREGPSTWTPPKIQETVAEEPPPRDERTRAAWGGGAPQTSRSRQLRNACSGEKPAQKSPCHDSLLAFHTTERHVNVVTRTHAARRARVRTLWGSSTGSVRTFGMRVWVLLERGVGMRGACGRSEQNCARPRD